MKIPFEFYTPFHLAYYKAYLYKYSKENIFYSHITGKEITGGVRC